MKTKPNKQLLTVCTTLLIIVFIIFEPIKIPPAIRQYFWPVYFILICCFLLSKLYSTIKLKKSQKVKQTFSLYNDQFNRTFYFFAGAILLIVSMVPEFNLYYLAVIGFLALLNGFYNIPSGLISIENNLLIVKPMKEKIDLQTIAELQIFSHLLQWKTKEGAYFYISNLAITQDQGIEIEKYMHLHTTHFPFLISNNVKSI